MFKNGMKRGKSKLYDSVNYYSICMKKCIYICKCKKISRKNIPTINSSKFWRMGFRGRNKGFLLFVLCVCACTYTHMYLLKQSIYSIFIFKKEQSTAKTLNFG